MASTTNRKGLFVAWRIFQRRNVSVAREFELETRFYYKDWEEKTKIHKACSYYFKSIAMVRDLIIYKPPVLFLQLPPVPLLYIARLYCSITGTKLVADCHNVMIYGKWLRWPFTERLLRTADAMLVHNEDVSDYASRMRLEPVTLRDPLPGLKKTKDLELLSRFKLRPETYVIVPWSFSYDEPIEELVEAAAKSPEITYVMTWFAERLSSELRKRVSSNLILTGYLDNDAFNALFSQAGVALVLTKREGTQPSAASEAISLGVPLVISKLDTTRKLYGDVPVYVDNTEDSIRSGIIKAFEDRENRIYALKEFSKEYQKKLEAEVLSVKKRLV